MKFNSPLNALMRDNENTETSKTLSNDKRKAIVFITRNVVDDIEKSIGQKAPETGGMLGGNRAAGIITTFHFDKTANCTGGTYTPDHAVLTHLLKNDWNPENIDLMGMAHSHPDGFWQPSMGDEIYAARFLKHNPQIEMFALPIVKPFKNNNIFEIFPYVAVRNSSKPHGVEIRKAEFRIVDNNFVEQVMKQKMEMTDAFARVREAYDLSRMAKSRLIIVGAGGSAQFIEDMARAGVGEFVLIDPDEVSETNIATQQVYRKDIGRPKVDCIAERLRDINPMAKIVLRRQWLDEIGDEEFKILALKPFGKEKPITTLLCGFTDNFEAQARVNRLALNFGLPSLSAQLYFEGRGLEITFTYPGVTQSCQRCVLSQRYKAYLDNGYKNTVTSHGTPIFATTRLNALKGFIAMAILHHGMKPQNEEGQDLPSYKRWGNLLERIGDRNLIMIRADPDLGIRYFKEAFAGAEQSNILFDETIWRPQKADCPENGYANCPDCGGTGNLHAAIGTFKDTREMRPQTHPPSGEVLTES